MLFSNKINTAILSVLLAAAGITHADPTGSTDTTDTINTNEITDETTGLSSDVTDTSNVQLPAHTTENSDSDLYDDYESETEPRHLPSGNFDKEMAYVQFQFIGETKRKLSDLLSMINNDQINSLESKKKTQEYLKSLIKMTTELQTNKFVGFNSQEVLFSLLSFNEAVMTHVLESLSKGFKSIQPLGIPELLNKYQETTKHRSPRTYSRIIAHNQKLFKIFSEQVDKAGLRWHHRAYRKVDDLVVDPVLRYNLIPYGLVAGSIGAAGLLAWWKFGHESFEKSSYVPDYIKEAFGPAPGTPKPLFYKNILNSDGTKKRAYDEWGHEMFRGTEEMTTLGKLTEVVNSNSLLAATFMTAWCKDWLVKEWNNKIKPAMLNKIEVTRNRLKGGIHNKIADQLDKVADPVTFKDLIGIDDVVEKFKLIVNYMENPELYNAFGTVPDKGYLLIGPPRTGKTLSVQALFNELKQVCKARKITHYNITPMDVWRNGLKYIFAEAQQNAPCILFIDEIDLLKLQRGGGDTTSLNEFLTGMSGLLDNKDPKKQVIIIAATNKPETLDFALKQPGRFGTEIRFKLPSLEVRKETIRRKLEKLAITFANSDKAIEKIALETAGASFEALNKLVADAFLYARNAQETFSEKHLIRALNTSIRKITAHLNERIPEYEQRIMATHFAGQALALVLLYPVAKLARVTILPHMPILDEESIYKLTFSTKKDQNTEQDRYKYGAVYTYKDHDSADINSRDEILKQCKMHVAGIVAEELIFGAPSHSCNRDAMGQAIQCAKLLTFEGMKEDGLPKEESTKRFKEAVALVEQCKKEVKTLLSAHKDRLNALINELQDRKQLSQAEVLAIVGDVVVTG